MAIQNRQTASVLVLASTLLIASSMQSFSQNDADGTIQGTINYPSDFVPPDMRVCAVEASGKKEFCTTRKTKTGTLYRYSLRVPPGEYYVYAATNDPLAAELRGYKAFYTEYVRCGLRVGCQSHQNIRVRVISNAIVKGVDPQDWYQ